jgi:prepilin-type N-terminal cleavage/methylation domain-containing protein/prepilin-type processing-associated H-X9-DG protein
VEVIAMDIGNGKVRRGRDAGFTLIELLVVISIIALLTAMLMPAFKAIRATAKTIDCGMRMSQINLCFQNYLSEQRGRYPWGWTPSTANWGGWSRAITNLQEGFVGGVAGYQRSGAAEVAKMFYCSEDRMRPEQTLSSVGVLSTPGVVWDLFISHGYNGHCIGGASGYSTPATQQPLRAIGIANPAETVLVADSGDPTTSYGGVRAKGYVPGHGLVAANSAPPVYPRHKGGTTCMVLWVDGHASPVRAAGPGDYRSLYQPRMLGRTEYWDFYTKSWVNTPSHSNSCWDSL